ncbi:hypothetical protein QBC46DRAFT_275264 [Diplogelasinospora grovesii]|uniref:2EXR domain-containing protein n=1 Tax=Diplogelasinospora grovesii TaxID=303347 RepID=A0AAN6MXG9_9PEZI|nr:hypothetical protein QBC46DRAFT_275264 [Diplogelasinospora grovesii]
MCSEFHLFTLLPPELRLLVWRYALPGPVLLLRTWNNAKSSYAIRNPVPSLLQVCQETRQWFIQGASKQSPYRYQFICQREGEAGGVYINWAIDEIYIERGYNIKDFELAQLQQLRCLRMLWGLRPCWVQSSLNDGIGFIRHFPNLQSLTIVVEFSPQGLSYKWTVRLEEVELRRIEKMILTDFKLEENRDQFWVPPELRVIGIYEDRKS